MKHIILTELFMINSLDVKEDLLFGYIENSFGYALLRHKRNHYLILLNIIRMLVLLNILQLSIFFLNKIVNIEYNNLISCI